MKVGQGKMQLIPSCQQWILKIISWHTQLCVNHNSGIVTFSFNFTGAVKKCRFSIICRDYLFLAVI